MSSKVAVQVPKEYVWGRSSGANTIGFGSAIGLSYTWESFNGDVYFVGSVDDDQAIIECTLYINNAYSQSKKTRYVQAGNGGVYECIFSGLSYGDEYYCVFTLDDNSQGRTYVRKYIGCLGEAPSLLCDDNLITPVTSYPYNKEYSMSLGVLEFDSDYGDLNSYSREARNRFYVACLQNTEYHSVLGKVGNWMSYYSDQYTNNTWTHPSVFKREAGVTRFFAPGVKVCISSPSSSSNYSIISQYVNQWIDDVNDLIGSKFFVRNDNINNTDRYINITIGSHYDLFGYSPEEEMQHGDPVDIYFGTWQCTECIPINYYNEIISCEVKICNELRGAIYNTEAFKDIIYEELTQAIGCGNDTYHTYNSMFSQIWYKGKSNNLWNGNLPSIDGEVVKMLYTEFNNGDRASDVIHRLTPSINAVIQLPCEVKGVPGHSYTVIPFAINRLVTWDEDGYWYWNDSNNGYSNLDYSKAITVTPNNSSVDFRWSEAIAKGSPINGVLYTEWNSFVGCVIDVLKNKKSYDEKIGESKYGYSSNDTYGTLAEAAKMTSADREMTAQRFNLVKYCIGSHNTTGISDKVSKVSPIIASEFHTLARKLNDWKNG